MARPTEFTRENVEKVLRAIRMGATYNLACLHAGISYDTLNRWKNGKFPSRLDDDQQALKASFATDLARAEGDSGVRALSTIQQAMAQGDAKSAQWLLERRWPHEYGKTVNEVVGKDGGPIQFEAQAAKLIEAEAKALGIEGADASDLQEAFIDYLNNRGDDDE